MRSKRNPRGARHVPQQTAAEKRPYLSIGVAGAGLLVPLSEVSEILGHDAVAELPGAAEQLEPSEIQAPPTLYGAAPTALRGVHVHAGANLALLDFALLLTDVALQDSPVIPANDDALAAILPPSL